MSLQAILDAFHNNWGRRVGPAACGELAIEIEQACCSKALSGAAAPGQPFPMTTTLLDADGQVFDLANFEKGKPLVVKIYRGGWCPYCRIDLRAFEAAIGGITSKGAAAVAISAELPKHIATTIAENDLTFPVLSDKGGELTKALGLHLTFTPEVIAAMDLDLKTWHGADTWFLPAPATYVLSPDRTIAEAFVSPDYRKRAEPDKIITLL
jgi:peroxiredoxin